MSSWEVVAIRGFLSGLTFLKAGKRRETPTCPAFRKYFLDLENESAFTSHT